MGFSTTVAQLVSAPPYVAAAFTAVAFAMISDRFYWRMPFVATPLMLVTIGYSIVISLKGALADNKAVGYFAIVLAVMGIYPIQAAAASWNANNIAPAARRSIGIALAQGSGNMGGIVGSYMFLAKESPKYPTGFGLSLAFGASGFLVCFFMEAVYKYGNAKKAKLADEAKIKYSEEELFDMGDKSPLFKYVL